MARPQWLANQSHGVRTRQLASVLTTGIAAGGFASSIYGLFQHYSPRTPIPCGAGLSYPVNCPAISLVLRSTIVGVPIALLSSVFFLLTLGFCLPSAWRTRRAWVHMIRIAMVAGGIGFLLYLIAVEPVLFEEHNPVFITTGVLTFALFVTTIATSTTLIQARGIRFGLRPLPT
jgi:uncharacterized membrane protein